MSSTPNQKDTTVEQETSSSSRRRPAQENPRPFIDHPSNYLAVLEAAGPDILAAVYVPVHHPWEPRWWFFHGKQTEPEFLQSAVGIESGIELKSRPAHVRGYKVVKVGAFEALVSVVTDLKVTGRAFMIERQEYEDQLLALQPDIFQEGPCTVCLDDSKEGEEEYRNRLGCYLEYAGDASKLDM